MADVLTADDPRYKELFDVAKEAEEFGNSIEADVNVGLNALRDQAPVMPGELRELLHLPERGHAMWTTERGTYTLLSFKACDRALRENVLFSSHVYRESPGVQTLGKSILEMTGDEHLRYRAVVQPMFLKPKTMTWWRQNWIDEIVDQLLGRLEGMDRADLNFDLCARLPMSVVTRGIGLQGEQALTFRDHLLKATGVRRVEKEEQIKSHGEVERMLRELITERRATPGDDVVTGLTQNDFALANDGGSRKLTDEEIMGYCRLILLAGGGTTWRQLGITIHTLMTHYHFWEALKADRKALEGAVDESARWMPTDPVFPRLMMEDTEVEGVMVPAGVRVDVCLGSANRDPTRWDNPDAYDPFRAKKTHLGFAMGPHQCLGMNVAKQEMIIALDGLMDRFPNMRLDPDAPPPRIVGGLEQRGMSAVPVLLN